MGKSESAINSAKARDSSFFSFFILISILPRSGGTNSQEKSIVVQMAAVIFGGQIDFFRT
jgi:hypothetical protein